MTGRDARPVLVGEAPSGRGDRYHAFPLSGPPARVLCQLAGIPPVEGGTTYGRWTWALYDRFECSNVFERYRDATPWSAPRARARLEERLPDLYGRVVVCLGRRPQKALADALELRRLADEPFHAFTLVSSTPARPESWLHVAAIPHPSGLNRALNDADERDRCGETLRRALDLADRLARGVPSSG